MIFGCLYVNVKNKPVTDTGDSTHKTVDPALVLLTASLFELRTHDCGHTTYRLGETQVFLRVDKDLTGPHSTQ